jgi:hypothetical protein
MRKLLPCLVLLATVLTFCRASMAIELPLATDSSRAGNTLVLVGGMGGGTGGGMGGMAGGGMGGMAGGGMGGMTGGGMGGMTGGGMGGGMGGFGAPPGNSPSGLYGGVDRTGAGVQPAQYYLCVTPYDRCSLASSPGSLRSGSSCTCSTGHRGNIK